MLPLPTRLLPLLGSISAILIFTQIVTAQTTDLNLRNEAGSLLFSLNVVEGVASYRIDHLELNSRTPVLRDSPLGLTRTDAEFTKGLEIISASPAVVVEDSYTLMAGKQRNIHSRGLERNFTFRNSKGLILTLTVRAYRDGIAFRYGLPGAGTQLLRVSDESTGFQLPDQARVWTQPYSKVDTWAPAYESVYANGIPAGTAAPGPEGWSFPLLYQAAGVWALVTETGLEPTYFASHLQAEAVKGLYRIRLPENAETYGVAAQEATITLPWLSPWRLIIVGQHPGVIVESTLVTDLARSSELKDTSWIKPGVASWSWWSDMSSPSDFAKLVPFVDAAAHFHWRYTLVDLGWHEMKGGTIKQLVDYAAKKQVGVLVWYNSAGKHNQVPGAGPKDLLNDPLLREAEFARIAALGIKGIKVDFMQSDKQFMIGLYHDIIRDAARHKLLVNFHGATIPRGWDRTYPNLITMEAVRGAEQYWDKNFAEKAHTLQTIYVFTRNAVGPMDFTPTVLTDPGASNPTLQPHLTTQAHELALLIVFQSGIQHVIDPAASLMHQPDYVQDYLTDLPTAWDESHLLAGSPGELAVLARRSGKIWYLAGINGRDESQSVKIPLAFLGAGKQTLSLISDGAISCQSTHSVQIVDAEGVLEINLAGRGGFAAKCTRN